VILKITKTNKTTRWKIKTTPMLCKRGAKTPLCLKIGGMSSGLIALVYALLFRCKESHTGANALAHWIAYLYNWSKKGWRQQGRGVEINPRKATYCNFIQLCIRNFEMELRGVLR
jgi:hypothetical protein